MSGRKRWRDTPVAASARKTKRAGTYQRSIEGGASKRLITKIAENWDWRLCLPLLVSRRGGELFVIDGQHRKEAAELRGDIPRHRHVRSAASDPGRDGHGDQAVALSCGTGRSRLWPLGGGVSGRPERRRKGKQRHSDGSRGMSERTVLRLPERLDTKSFPGDFMLTFRIRRRTFDEVEAAAQKLLTRFPGETFYIDRQIARVKLKPQERAA